MKDSRMPFSRSDNKCQHVNSNGKGEFNGCRLIQKDSSVTDTYPGILVCNFIAMFCSDNNSGDLHG